jgi:hypothetical protein
MLAVACSTPFNISTAPFTPFSFVFVQSTFFPHILSQRAPFCHHDGHKLLLSKHNSSTPHQHNALKRLHTDAMQPVAAFIALRETLEAGIISKCMSPPSLANNHQLLFCSVSSNN